MRSRYCIEWIGEGGTGFSAFERTVEELGIVIKPISGIDAADGCGIRAAAFHHRMSLDELEAVRQQLDCPKAAKLAVLEDNDAASIAKATAVDCDDILILPVGDAELARRLDNLHNLAGLRAEWRLRERLHGQFHEDGTERGLWPRQKRLDVVLAGPIGPAAGRLASMLQPAQIIFAEDNAKTSTVLAEQSVDLLFAEIGIADGDWRNINLPAHTKKVWVCDPDQDRLRSRQTVIPKARFDDVIEADLASDLLRPRIRILRRLTTIGQDLCLPSGSSIPPGILDAETDLPNASYARAYLSERGKERDRHFATFDLIPDNLGRLVQELGYAGLTKWLREAATALRRQLRADDLLCHLSEGRFRVVLQNCERNAATKVSKRLARASMNRLRVAENERSRRYSDRKADVMA